MIKSLGLQKVVMIAFFAVVLAVIYFYGVMGLGPKGETLDRNLRAEQSEFNQIADNLTNLRTGIEKFEVQKDKFTNLQTLGFFDTQDRVNLTRTLDEMQKKSGLLALKYSVNPATTEKNTKAVKAGYKILLTPIDFDLEAILDEEIYQFVYFLNYGFPGHITIEEMSVSQATEVTSTVLQQIGTNRPSAIIRATIKVNLRTLVKDPTVTVNPSEMGGILE